MVSGDRGDLFSRRLLDYAMSAAHDAEPNRRVATEFIYRHAFATREQARPAVGRWIDNFYNARRRHGWCGGISPIDYEHQQKINNADYPSAA